MNKRILSLVMAVALAVSIFAFSAMAESKPFEGVTITFWAGQTELNPGTLAVIEAAEEALGLHVETEINPGGSEGDNILKTRINSNDLPDFIQQLCDYRILFALSNMELGLFSLKHPVNLPHRTAL